MSDTRRAAGSFEVVLTPLATDWPADGATLGRMAIDKQFHGDLEATGSGEMLSARTTVQGSGAYSAIERVTGTLHGGTGTFALQHTGIMNRGVASLVITVVPDSGTGDLAGLSGTMTISMVEGKHSYGLEYSLEPPRA